MMPTHTQCACTPGSVLTGVHWCQGLPSVLMPGGTDP